MCLFGGFVLFYFKNSLMFEMLKELSHLQAKTAEFQIGFVQCHSRFGSFGSSQSMSLSGNSSHDQLLMWKKQRNLLPKLCVVWASWCHHCERLWDAEVLNCLKTHHPCPAALKAHIHQCKLISVTFPASLCLLAADTGLGLLLSLLKSSHGDFSWMPEGPLEKQDVQKNVVLACLNFYAVSTNCTGMG